MDEPPALLEQLEQMKLELDSLRRAQSQVRVVFPPRERKVQKFSGREGDALSFSDFLIDVKSVWDSRPDITPADKAGVIISNLEGPAREEVKCLDAEAQRDPTKVEAALKAAFSERLSVSQLMAKYYSRKQGASETLQEYSLNLRQLARRIQSAGGVTEGIGRDVFIENLLNKQLRHHLKQLVRGDSTLTFEGVLEAARLWEEDLGESGTGKKTNANVRHQDAVGTDPIQNQDRGLAELSARVDEQQKTLAEMASALNQLVKGQGQTTTTRGNGNLTQQPTRNSQGKLICYNCNKPGHIAIRCPVGRRGYTKQNHCRRRSVVQRSPVEPEPESGQLGNDGSSQ